MLFISLVQNRAYLPTKLNYARWYEEKLGSYPRYFVAETQLFLGAK